MSMATTTMDRRVISALGWTWQVVNRPIAWRVRIRIAGPAANAEARKRGAITAEFQNGRPPSPEYRNAVTVWMLMAQAMEMNTKGMTKALRGFRPRYAQ